MTTIQANQATGTAYSGDQIAAAVTPVLNALDDALSELTATIPSLPPTTTSAAQTLSSTLAQSIQVFKMGPLPEVGNYPGNALLLPAEENFDVTEYTSELSSQSSLDYTAAYAFLHVLDNNVAQ